MGRLTPEAEPLFAHQVNGDALEEAAEVGEAVTAPLDDLKLVVHTLDKAAGLAGNEVVGD